MRVRERESERERERDRVRGEKLQPRKWSERKNRLKYR